MSKPRPLMLSKKATALASAALRHVRDAEHLLGSSGGHASPDQAYHLSAFGPECARKATIAEDWLDKVIGHGTTGGADEVLEFAVSIDPVAHRYDIMDFESRFPALARWTVESRYEKTNTRNISEATEVCREAREIVDNIVLALWADGRFDDKETLF